ncbi:winged helix-turn-helix domain-containing protein [Streptomyces sp. NPDC003877]
MTAWPEQRSPARTRRGARANAGTPPRPVRPVSPRTASRSAAPPAGAGCRGRTTRRRRRARTAAGRTRPPDCPHSRQQILDRVWDPHYDGPTKTLDVHVAALRRTLGHPAWTRTLRGVGLVIRLPSARPPGEGPEPDGDRPRRPRRQAPALPGVGDPPVCPSGRTPGHTHPAHTRPRAQWLTRAPTGGSQHAAPRPLFVHAPSTPCP